MCAIGRIPALEERLARVRNDGAATRARHNRRVFRPTACQLPGMVYGRSRQQQL